MKRLSPVLLVALVVLAAAAGAYAALRANRADADERAARHDALDLRAMPSNTTRGDLAITPHAHAPGARVTLSILDPSNATFASVWNASLTEGRTALVPLDRLPELFIVMAQYDETGAPTALKWAWQGRAHLLVADTPEGLAGQLQGARA